MKEYYKILTENEGMEANKKVQQEKEAPLNILIQRIKK